MNPAASPNMGAGRCALALLTLFASAAVVGCAGNPSSSSGTASTPSTPSSAPSGQVANDSSGEPPWHLTGYYNLNWTSPSWVSSNDAPWTPDPQGAWVDQRLVKWGYTPVTHDKKNYYCLIGHYPQIGTRVNRRNFACGDAWAVLQQYNNGHPPTFLLYGGDPRLNGP